MTGRHAGLPAPTDIWLQDQYAAWLQQFDTFMNDCAAATERMSSLATEQVWRQVSEQSARKTVLLCTARQLIGEAMNRG